MVIFTKILTAAGVIFESVRGVKMFDFYRGT